MNIIKLLNKAIKRWENRANGKEKEPSCCVLCTHFVCLDCPITIFTGESGCKNTPFFKWHDAKAENNLELVKTEATNMVKLLKEVKQYFILKPIKHEEIPMLSTDGLKEKMNLTELNAFIQEYVVNKALEKCNVINLGNVQYTKHTDSDGKVSWKTPLIPLSTEELYDKLTENDLDTLMQSPIWLKYTLRKFVNNLWYRSHTKEDLANIFTLHDDINALYTLFKEDTEIIYTKENLKFFKVDTNWFGGSDLGLTNQEYYKILDKQRVCSILQQYTMIVVGSYQYKQQLDGTWL
jgi:hypothetical protein